MERIRYPDEVAAIIQHRESCQYDIPEYEGLLRTNRLSISEEYLLVEVCEDSDVSFEVSYGICEE